MGMCGKRSGRGGIDIIQLSTLTQSGHTGNKTSYRTVSQTSSVQVVICIMGRQSMIKVDIQGRQTS
jgi:hypothetical protein